MKFIIISLLISASISTQAQKIFTTAQLSDYLRSQWKTNDTVRSKQAIKDIRDDERNVQIKSLNDGLDSLKKVVDKMSFNLSGDFFVDTVGNTLYLSGKEDTLIVKRLNYNSTLNRISSINNSIISNGYVDNLKFQISELEISVNRRDKIIDRLQLTLKKERAKNKPKK